MLAADVVAPESGNDSIWLVFVPCTAVKFILGVADDIVFIFSFSWISDMIPCALMSERALMSISSYCAGGVGGVFWVGSCCGGGEGSIGLNCCWLLCGLGVLQLLV